MADYTSMTKAQLVALLVERDARPERAMSEASAHYVAGDIPCPVAGDKCLSPAGKIRTYRTQAGADKHAAEFGATVAKHDNHK